MATEPQELKARATKEELIAHIEKLEEQVKELQDQLNQQKATASAGKRGWLISTPNPSYSGYTFGVWFNNGHAFVSEETPEARKVVNVLTKDRGYSATFTENGEPVAEPPPAPKYSITDAAAQPHFMGVKK